MADLIDRQLLDAGLTLLRADPALVVYPDVEGQVPATPEPPYVRVYGAVGRPPGPGNALDGLSRQLTARWWCHCVGTTEPAALAVAMRVRVALLDARINGGMVRQEVGDQPPVRDETTGVPVYDVVAVYRLISY